MRTLRLIFDFKLGILQKHQKANDLVRKIGNFMNLDTSKKSILLLFTLPMIVSCIYGVYINYSVIPFWDVWNGTVEFILKINDGQYSEWWAQHNEHRIILSRILFYIDYKFFNGSFIFLSFVNLILLFLNSYVLYLFAKRLQNLKPQKANAITMAYLIILGFCFSWMQENNITWVFQSQFFLAQFLPLLSLYLASSDAECPSKIKFTFALLVGVASFGSMANGILNLPMLAIFYTLVFRDWSRILIILFVACVMSWLYFMNYSPVSGHGSLSDGILNHPIKLLHFTIYYIGSPVYHLTQNHFLTQLASLVLICSSAYIGFRYVFMTNRNPQAIALILFILYIGATGFGTAGGRYIFGLEAATASRYTTPAILAWSASILLIVFEYDFFKKRWNKITLLALIVLCVLALGQQVDAFKPNKARIFERRMGVLALELGVRDEGSISAVFPFIDWVIEIANRASELNLSVFGTQPYIDLRETLHTSVTITAELSCRGSLDEIYHLENDDTWIKVRGWLFDAEGKDIPTVIKFANSDGEIIGYGLTGSRRLDVATEVAQDAEFSGYLGYVEKGALGSGLIALSQNPKCNIKFE